MPADVHGILLLDKPLGLELGRRRGARQAPVRRAQGRPHRLARSAGLRACCRSASARRPSSARRCSTPTRPTGSRRASASARRARTGSRAVIERRELPPLLERGRSRRALERFPRDYAQVPPMHSAIKQDGRPLYEYARAGHDARARSRARIVIRELRLIELAGARSARSTCAARRAPTSACWRRISRRASAPSGTSSACAGWRSRRSPARRNGPSRRWRR